LAYCDLDDIREVITDDELIQLTDDERTGEIDTDRVDQAIASADSEIDGYCAARYSTPFSTVPALIKKCSVDIAVYNLHARRTQSIPEARQVRYDNAVRILKGLAAGTVTIEEATAPREKDTPSISSGDRIFTRDKLEGM